MQISRINANASFKGLWETKSKFVGNHRKENCPVYDYKYVYHPFKDETEKDIERALKKTTGEGIGEMWCPDGDPVIPRKIIVFETTVGKRLNITSNEYEEIKKMKEYQFPKNEYASIRCKKMKEYNPDSIYGCIEQ